MSETPDIRADKFIWAVRLYKTRSLSADACKKGRIQIDDVEIKPSRSIKVGDVISVKKPPVNYSYRVIGIPKNRVSAKLVENFIEDLTPAEELEKLELGDSFFIKRDRGAGRPTKKERRIIDKLRDK
ncbi:MAG: RNA-binding S4 domain-containing protein [Bacteroidales bacterium]